MNLNQKESDLVQKWGSKSIEYAKEAPKVPLLDDRCPCIVFLKRAQGGDGIISAPKLLLPCSTSLTHPRYNTYNHFFVEYPLK